MARKKKATRRSRSGRKRTSRKKPTEIKIRRSSGRKEKFDLERMVQSTSRSGVPFLMARDIAKNVSKQIKAESKGRPKKTVTAARVRKLIAGELSDRNHQAMASSYTGEVPENSRRGKPKVEPHESLTGSTDFDSVMHDRSKRLTSSA